MKSLFRNCRHQDERGITSIDKMQSNTTINVCIAMRCFYIASLNNDMFRLLYRPSSGCTFSYFKANYKINNFFFVFVEEKERKEKFSKPVNTFMQNNYVANSFNTDLILSNYLCCDCNHLHLPTQAYKLCRITICPYT